jgi:predicted SAM-dependent methyltransferase
MLINFASGTHPFPAPWWNLDLNQHPGVDEHVDLTAGLGTAADIELAYVGHFLEHLLYSECLAFLTRIRAAMRPGGRIVIVCPDADRAAAMAQAGTIGTDLLAAISPHGHRDGADVSHIHAWKCTPRKVRWLLEHAQFTEPDEIGFDDFPALGIPVISDAAWQLAMTATAP